MTNQRTHFDYKGYSYKVLTDESGEIDVVLISTDNRDAYLETAPKPESFPVPMLDLMESVWISASAA